MKVAGSYLRKFTNTVGGLTVDKVTQRNGNDAAGLSGPEIQGAQAAPMNGMALPKAGKDVFTEPALQAKPKVQPDSDTVPDMAKSQPDPFDEIDSQPASRFLTGDVNKALGGQSFTGVTDQGGKAAELNLGAATTPLATLGDRVSSDVIATTMGQDLGAASGNADGLIRVSTEQTNDTGLLLNVATQVQSAIKTEIQSETGAAAIAAGLRQISGGTATGSQIGAVINDLGFGGLMDFAFQVDSSALGNFQFVGADRVVDAQGPIETPFLKLAVPNSTGNVTFEVVRNVRYQIEFSAMSNGIDVLNSFRGMFEGDSAMQYLANHAFNMAVDYGIFLFYSRAFFEQEPGADQQYRNKD